MFQHKPAAEKIKAADSGNKKRRERKPPKKITAAYLHNAGLYYLQRFSASAAHFQKVMLRKIDRSCFYYEDQDREECLKMLRELTQRFQQAGLLNDESYARGMVESLRRRGKSGRMVRAKLAEKGLAQTDIETAMQDHEERQEGDVELRAALRLAQRKKIGPFSPAGESDDKAFTKALGIMARAGFSYELSRRVLEMERSQVDFFYE